LFPNAAASVAKIVTFASNFLKGVFLGETASQKCLAKVKPFARIFAKFEMLNMKIGYARVSTLEQNLDLQLRALEKAGCKKIFREKVSGSIRERPQFQRMLDQIRSSDTIVVWKLDRLARSTRDLLETMEAIREAGGKFQSLSEPWADTTTHAGKMIMTIFAGIAEFERDLIRERTSAGREAARKRGVLPEGFQRIRYYGFLANRYREQKLAHCRELLDMPAREPPALDGALQ
jgi:DNA invertase Pin-like site-specific DNA recombinase